MAVPKGGRNITGKKPHSRLVPRAREQAQVRNRPYFHLSRRSAGSFQGRSEKGQGLLRGNGLVLTQPEPRRRPAMDSGPHGTPGIWEAVGGIGAAAQGNSVAQETPAPVEQGLFFACYIP